MPDSVHAVLSPSSSEIWLKCTPSARFAADFPDETTEYAAEGTEAHSLAEHKLRKALGEETGDPRKGMKYLTDEMEECTEDYVSFIMEKLSVIRETCPDAVIFIEQNFGPHIEQKCADFAESFGRVSSWYSRARSGSRPILNWSSQRNSKRAFDIALSRIIAPGCPFARSAACAAIL